MAYETDSFTLSKKAVEATAETCRRVLGTLPSKPKVTRHVYQSSALIPMIVTETNQVSPNIGENVFIDMKYQQPASAGSAFAFKAKPYKAGATNLTALDGDEIYVDCTLISAVLFTGQLFLMSSDSPVKPQTFTFNGKSYDVQGQVLSNGIGNRWIGKYVTSPTKSVDINIFQAVSNTTANRVGTCRVSAINDTGTTLVSGQGVIMDYMSSDPAGGTNVNYNRWRISEYKCP